MNFTEIQKLTKEYAQEALEEALQQDDIDLAMDYLHEMIDQCADVIYYSKAWNLVNAARAHGALYDEGYYYLEETGMDKIQEGENLDTLMSRLAYCILYREASVQLQELIEEHQVSLEE